MMSPSPGGITGREAFPWDEAPRYLIHDRDHAFDGLGAIARAMGIEDVVTAPRAPWQNPCVERFVGCARRECFDPVIAFNEAGVRKLMTHYGSYYEKARTHLALDKDTPTSARSSRLISSWCQPQRSAWCSCWSCRYAVVILDDLPDFMREALTERFRPIWRPPYWTSSSADPNTSFTTSGSPSRLFLLPPTHLRGLKDGLEEADRHRR
jgi:hypothetical protein